MQPLDDSDELMSYRAAILGLLAAFAGIILWLWIAGMNPLVAALQMGIYLFFIAVIMSRGVAEAGLLMTETSFRPVDLMKMFFPVQSLGAVNLSMMGLLEVVFIRDLRGVMLSPFLDNQKMAGELKVRQRSLLWPLALAIVIAFVVASYFFLKFNYQLSGLSLYGYSNQNNARNVFKLTTAAMDGSLPPADSTAYGGFFLGTIATLFMVVMRARFVWFPFNPLAYAIAPTYAMLVLWFPCFLAWIIKGLTMRFGGIDFVSQNRAVHARHDFRRVHQRGFVGDFSDDQPDDFRLQVHQRPRLSVAVNIEYWNGVSRRKTGRSAMKRLWLLGALTLCAALWKPADAQMAAQIMKAAAPPQLSVSASASANGTFEMTVEKTNYDQTHTRDTRMQALEKQTQTLESSVFRADGSLKSETDSFYNADDSLAGSLTARFDNQSRLIEYSIANGESQSIASLRVYDASKTKTTHSVKYFSEADKAKITYFLNDFGRVVKKRS